MVLASSGSESFVAPQMKVPPPKLRFAEAEGRCVGCGPCRRLHTNPVDGINPFNRLFAGQKLDSCQASLTLGFFSFSFPQLYLRDVDDHIQCCSQRLNFAQDVLSGETFHARACALRCP